MLRQFRGLIGVALAAVLVGALLMGGIGARPAVQEGEELHGQYADVFVQRLAGLLGVEKDTLVGQMKQAANDTIDTAVTNGDLAPNQAQRLKDRIQTGDFGDGHKGMAHGYGMHDAHLLVRSEVAGAVAQRLGITTDELRKELHAGKTLHRIGQEHQVSDQELKEAMISVVQPRLSEAVEKGDLSQKQADRVTSRIESADLDLAYPALMGMDRSGRGMGGHHMGQQGGMYGTPDKSE